MFNAYCMSRKVTLEMVYVYLHIYKIPMLLNTYHGLC